MKRTTIYLTEPQVDTLREYTELSGIPTAVLIRKAITQFLATLKKGK